MQAIITTYISPLQDGSAQIRARCDARTIYVAYDERGSVEGNHVAAARALAEAIGWVPPYYGPMVSGTEPDASGHVMCHVFAERPRVVMSSENLMERARYLLNRVALGNAIDVTDLERWLADERHARGVTP